MIPEKTLEIIQPKSKTVEYKTWWRIQNRCYNPNSQSYKYYGGKGIKMCDKWKQSYESFLADMGRRPSKLHSIERKDGNKDYEPGNCYWATAKEQANNTSRNVSIEIDGITKTFAQWCDYYDKKPRKKYFLRYYRGWDIKDVFSKPLRFRSKSPKPSHE